MAQEGIGAALTIDETTLGNLKTAQERIVAMSTAAETLATKFESVKGSVQDMMSAISGNNVNVKFNTSGALESISVLSNAITQLQQKGSDASRTTTASEESLNNRLASILEKRADSYSAVKQRMSELLKFQEQWSSASEAATKKGEGAFSGDAYQKAEKYMASLQERLKYFNAEFSKEGAYRSENIAYWMDENTYKDALAKIQMLKSAQEEYLKPGASSTDPRTSSWITDHLSFLSDEIDRVTAKLPELKKQEEALTQQTKAGKASQRLDTALGMDESTIETTKDKIGQVKAAMVSLMHAAESNEYVDKAKIEQASQALERLRKKYSDLSKDQAISTSRGDLARTLSLDESSVANIQQKIEAIRSAMNNLRKTAGDKLNSSWLNDAGKKVDELDMKLKIANKSLAITNNSASQLGGMLRTAFSAALVTNFAQNIVKIRGEFEMAEKSLAIIVKDSNTAYSIFNEIKNIAIKSPFQVSDLVKQTKQLAAYRIETDKLIETTKMLGDISAGVGVDMNRLILAYGQVKAATYLKGTELRQFSEAGVNMLGGLADRLSELQGRMVTTGEVLQMVSNRMISFKDVDEVLRAETSAGGTFYKMQEQQAETLQGRISNIKDRVDIMFNSIGQSTQGILNTVLDAIEKILTNYQYLEAALTAGLVFKSLTAIAGQITGIVNALKQVKAFFSFVKDDGLLTTTKVLGNLGPIVAGLLAIAAAVAVIIVNANKLRNEIKKAAKDTEESSNEQILSYTKLAKVIEDSNKPLKERQEALEQLKSQFGKVLPLEDANLDTIKSSGDAYREYAQAIRESNNELLKEKELLLIQEDRQRKQAKNISRIETALKGTSAYMANRYSGTNKADYLDDEDGVISEAFVEVQEKIFNKEIKNAREAADELYEIVDNYYGKAAGATKGFVKEAGNDSVVMRQMQQIFKSFDMAENVTSRQIADFTVSQNGQGLAEAVKNLKNYKEEWKELHKYIVETDADGNEHIWHEETGGILDPNYENNEAALEKDAEEAVEIYVQKLRNAVEKNLDENGHPLEKALTMADKKRLTSMLDTQAQNLASPLEKSINSIYAKVNEKIGKNLLGTGQYQQNEGESLEDYVKRLKTMLQNAEGVKATWLANEKDLNNGLKYERDNLFETLKSSLGQTKEEASGVVEALKAAIPEIEKFLKIVVTKKEAAQRQATIKSYITEVRKAAKEIDDLNDQSKELLMNKLRAMAKEANVEFPEIFNADTVKNLVEDLKDKAGLKDADLIQFELDDNEDAYSKQVKAISDKISNLWDRYSSAKKFEQYGLNLIGYNSTQIWNQIREEAENLGKMTGKEAQDEFKSTTDKITGELRQRQEEAAKIIYEAEKKTLSKTEQIYQKMYEDIAIVRKQSNQEGIDSEIKDYTQEEGILAIVKKAHQDIAAAQWDAYKATSMYAMAFGDLGGLSKDVLISLRNQLEQFTKSGALDPTEIKTVMDAMKKLDEELASPVAGNFFEVISNGFQMLNEAAVLSNETIPALNDTFIALNNTQAQAMEDAQKAYEDAAAKAKANPDDEDAALQESIALANLVWVQESAATAAKNLSDAQKLLNAKLAKAQEELSSMTNAYNAVGSVVSSAVSAMRDFADAFGLSISDEANAAIDGFQQGFALVGSVLAVASAAMSAYAAAEKFAEAAGVELEAVLSGILWPLIAIGAALGAIVAIVKSEDARLENAVEAHTEAVEKLQKTYEDLEEYLDYAYEMETEKKLHNQMISNLEQQELELREAIDADRQRKQTDDVKNEIEDLEDQLEEVQDKMEEANRKKLELLGAPDNYQDVASDWASSWLDAFKETGDGLSALEESFDDLYDSLVAAQIQNLVIGPALTRLKALVNNALADWVITEDEAAEILAYKNELKETNEKAKDLATKLGTSVSDSSESDTLQKGVESVTEQTAQALESILNSTRYYVADNNRLLTAIDNALNNSEGENTILSNIRLQTKYLRSLAEIADSVYFPGAHSKGAGGIKVFVD